MTEMNVEKLEAAFQKASPEAVKRLLEWLRAEDNRNAEQERDLQILEKVASERGIA